MGNTWNQLLPICKVCHVHVQGKIVSKMFQNTFKFSHRLCEKSPSNKQCTKSNAIPLDTRQLTGPLKQFVLVMW